MALIARRLVSELGDDLVLVPERYDPRRDLARGGSRTIEIGELVDVSRELVHAARVRELARAIVLDTSHARDGLVETPSGAERDVRSAKKVLRPGDVIVSRLRPYLRQVAWIDAAVAGVAERATIVGSTEFVVLRARDRRSIAFLVPFLLSAPIQEVLAASQEGGHHPRVPEASLLALGLPHGLVARRDEVSRRVERAIGAQRRARAELLSLAAALEAELGASARRA